MEIEIINNVSPQTNHHDTKTDIPVRHTRPIVEEQMQTKRFYSDTELNKMISELKKELLPYNNRLKLSINKEIDRVIVKVIDKNTDRVIKEIPPVEIQHMIASIRRALGLLIDKEI